MKSGIAERFPNNSQQNKMRIKWCIFRENCVFHYKQEIILKKDKRIYLTENIHIFPKNINKYHLRNIM